MLNALRQAPVPITAPITAQTPDADLAVRGAHGDEAVTIDWPATALYDIDTPDDYRAATRRHAPE